MTSSTLSCTSIRSFLVSEGLKFEKNELKVTKMGNSISKVWKDSPKIRKREIVVLHPKPPNLKLKNDSESSDSSSALPSPTMPREPPPHPPPQSFQSPEDTASTSRPLPPTPDVEYLESNWKLSLPLWAPPPVPKSPPDVISSDESIEESIYLLPEVQIASSVSAERRTLPGLLNHSPSRGSPSRSGSNKSSSSDPQKPQIPQKPSAIANSFILSRNQSFPAAMKPRIKMRVGKSPKKPNFKPPPPKDDPKKASQTSKVSEPKTSPKTKTPETRTPETKALSETKSPPVRPPPPSESSIKKAQILKEARKKKENSSPINRRDLKHQLRKHQSFNHTRPNLLHQFHVETRTEEDIYQSIPPLNEPHMKISSNRQPGFSQNIFIKTTKKTKNFKTSIQAKAEKLKNKVKSLNNLRTSSNPHDDLHPDSNPNLPKDVETFYYGIDDNPPLGVYGEIEDGIYLNNDV